MRLHQVDPCTISNYVGQWDVVVSLIEGEVWVNCRNMQDKVWCSWRSRESFEATKKAVAQAKEASRVRSRTAS